MVMKYSLLTSLRRVSREVILPIPCLTQMSLVLLLSIIKECQYGVLPSEVGLKDIGENAPLLDDGMDTDEDDNMVDATNIDDYDDGEQDMRIHNRDDVKVVVTRPVGT